MSTQAMIDAANAYFEEKSGGNFRLPAQFNWHECLKRALAAVSSEAQPLALPRSQPTQTGVGKFCHPGPPDEQKQLWLLMYDDNDRGYNLFDDEEEARTQFAESEGRGWNCHLFTSALRHCATTAPDVRPSVPVSDEQWEGNQMDVFNRWIISAAKHIDHYSAMCGWMQSARHNKALSTQPASVQGVSDKRRFPSFEAWAKDYYSTGCAEDDAGILTRADIGGEVLYADERVLHAWWGWEAAISLFASQPAAPVQQEAVAKIKAAAFMQIAKNSQMLFEVRDLISTLTDPKANCPGRTEEARRLLPLMDAYLNQPAAQPVQDKPQEAGQARELPPSVPTKTSERCHACNGTGHRSSSTGRGTFFCNDCGGTGEIIYRVGGSK